MAVATLFCAHLGVGCELSVTRVGVKACSFVESVELICIPRKVRLRKP